jgi:predicted nucleic acid-binding Zn ribbon protein
VLPLAPGESAGRYALVTIDLSCRACGSNRIAFNHAVSDACEVVCEECGARVGNYGELKQAVAEQLALG